MYSNSLILYVFLALGYYGVIFGLHFQGASAGSRGNAGGGGVSAVRRGGETDAGLLSPAAAPLRVGPINVDAQTDGRSTPLLVRSLEGVHSGPPRVAVAPRPRRDLFWKPGRSLVEPA